MGHPGYESISQGGLAAAAVQAARASAAPHPPSPAPAPVPASAPATAPEPDAHRAAAALREVGPRPRTPSLAGRPRTAGLKRRRGRLGRVTGAGNRGSEGAGVGRPWPRGETGAPALWARRAPRRPPPATARADPSKPRAPTWAG